MKLYTIALLLLAPTLINADDIGDINVTINVRTEVRDSRDQRDNRDYSSRDSHDYDRTDTNKDHKK